MAMMGELTIEEVSKVFSTHYQKVLQDLIEKEMNERAKEFIWAAAEKLAKDFVARMHIRQDPMSFKTEVHVTVDGVTKKD